MSIPRSRFRLNAPGDFFVEAGMCIACTAPEHEAPELMGHVPGGDDRYHCYFRRPPETPAEVELAIRAVHVSCREAVRCGGSDPDISGRIDGYRRGLQRADP